jgi:hypothetical protein
MALCFLAAIFEPQSVGRVVVPATAFLGGKGRFSHAVPKKYNRVQEFS